MRLVGVLVVLASAPYVEGKRVATDVRLVLKRTHAEHLNFVLVTGCWWAKVCD